MMLKFSNTHKSSAGDNGTESICRLTLKIYNPTKRSHTCMRYPRVARMAKLADLAYSSKSAPILSARE